MYLRNHRRKKAWFLKRLKIPMSEQHLWSVNMLKGKKHCLNLHRKCFVRYFDHSKKTSVRKILS